MKYRIIKRSFHRFNKFYYQYLSEHTNKWENVSWKEFDTLKEAELHVEKQIALEDGFEVIKEYDSINRK